jgi:indolepyruvate ferredoxin oxidoreductase alpha subunit
MHAGISAAYAYPGTPSTEILQYLINEYAKGGPVARWCANEKTALEAALGVSFAGRRSIAVMKHVGLNVASEAFVNAALLDIKGGLVVVVADDPGMHSSQNEQDSRFYAAFAMVPCLEPRSQQEAYNMTREAFDLSERFKIPVMIRLTTRLAHARAGIRPQDALEQKPVSKAMEKNRWMLLPAFARSNYEILLEKQKDFQAWSTAHPANKLELPELPVAAGAKYDLAVITAGLGGNYYEDNLYDLNIMRNSGSEVRPVPARLHISAYPIPMESIRALCAASEKVLVLEEGQPFIEEKLRGILTQSIPIAGKLGGFDGGPAPVARTGELDPDNVRSALGLPPHPGVPIPDFKLPGRPPQLCQGCPHADSFEAIKKAVEEIDPRPGHPDVGINSDIGCYSLGVMPPYEIPESIVCMGASVGMAKGAADAGLPYSIAVVGDSTFIHSGITNLIDAVDAESPMTLIILDNSTVAMTGCQQTMVPSERLADLVIGCGVVPEHVLELDAKKQFVDENAAALKAEIEYPGLSVVIFERECLEAIRKNRNDA